MAERLFFPVKERLKSSYTIKMVFKKGKQRVCQGARLFFLPNALDYNRIAFVFSKKFGNAVRRNRARRLGREAYRSLRGKLRSGFDMVLLVYPDDDAHFCVRLKQLEALLQQAPALFKVKSSDEAGST